MQLDAIAYPGNSGGPVFDLETGEVKVLKIAAEKAGWGRKLPKGRAMGIAIMEGYGTYLAMVAEISVEKGALSIHRITCRVLHEDRIHLGKAEVTFAP